MNAYTVLTVPGIDASIAVATSGRTVSFALLAKGRSRKADRTYTKRNPERRALWLHILANLPACDIIAIRGGRSDAPITRAPDLTRADLASAYSAAGNYRLDFVVSFLAPVSVDDLALSLGLTPKNGARAPKEVKWLS